MQYPPQFAIQPLTNIPRATVRVPGSKSITNRALVLAALTASPGRAITLDGALHSEDTVVMADSLRRLGFRVDADEDRATLTLHRPGGDRVIPVETADLYLANSGTSMRFLTAMVALGQGRYRLDGVARMRERPIADLLDALRQLGIDANSETANGCPPVVVHAAGVPGGAARIRGDVSSQFLSGLMMAAPFARSALTIDIEGVLVSVPYVTMTVAMMRQFGLVVETDGLTRFRVPAPQRPAPLARYAIEPDASAASYFFGAAAITGGTVGVAGLPADCLQGDIHFVDALEKMGCRVERTSDTVVVTGGVLHGVDLDMNAISDTVMTLGAVACFAEGPTRIRNVAHIRHKETDRLAALATELRRVGAEVFEEADGLTITPRPLRGAVLQTYHDHRMAMSLALVGLKVPGVVIDNPACVAKTYPRFFDDLDRLRK